MIVIPGQDWFLQAEASAYLAWTCLSPLWQRNRAGAKSQVKETRRALQDGNSSSTRHLLLQQAQVALENGITLHKG